MLNGLDLFTGIGGITLALREWVRPVAYCEIEPYCQSVLLQRMQEENLPKAPIWDDIRTLSFSDFNIDESIFDIDIIYGGFPCQDISVAGHGKGLEGERSGLFFEIMRLAEEIKPKFIFLENVPAITRRGGLQVVREITSLGYDCRWCMLSASEVGAMHKRERWFLLAYSKHNGTLASERGESLRSCIAQREQYEQEEGIGEIERAGGISRNVADTMCKGLEGQRRSTSRITQKKPLSSVQSKDDSNTNGKSSKQTNQSTMSFSTKGNSRRDNSTEYWPFESRTHWQEIVSTICRVDDGVSNRVDRLKALGNSVVPIQVRQAFIELMGL